MQYASSLDVFTGAGVLALVSFAAEGEMHLQNITGAI